VALRRAVVRHGAAVSGVIHALDPNHILVEEEAEQRAELEQNLNKALKEKEMLTEELENSLSKIDELMDAKEELERDISNLSRANENLMNEIELLNSENIELKQDIEHFHCIKGDLDKQISELTDSLEYIKLSPESKTIESFNTDNAALATQHRTNGDHADADSISLLSHNSHSHLQKVLVVKCNEIEVLKKENEKLQSIVADNDQESALLNQELVVARSEILKLEEHIQQLSYSLNKNNSHSNVGIEVNGSRVKDGISNLSIENSTFEVNDFLDSPSLRESPMIGKAWNLSAVDSAADNGECTSPMNLNNEDGIRNGNVISNQHNRNTIQAMKQLKYMTEHDLSFVNSFDELDFNKLIMLESQLADAKIEIEYLKDKLNTNLETIETLKSKEETYKSRNDFEIERLNEHILDLTKKLKSSSQIQSTYEIDLNKLKQELMNVRNSNNDLQHLNNQFKNEIKEYMNLITSLKANEASNRNQISPSSGGSNNDNESSDKNLLLLHAQLSECKIENSQLKEKLMISSETIELYKSKEVTNKSKYDVEVERLQAQITELKLQMSSQQQLNGNSDATHIRGSAYEHTEYANMIAEKDAALKSANEQIEQLKTQVMEYEKGIVVPNGQFTDIDNQLLAIIDKLKTELKVMRPVVEQRQNRISELEGMLAALEKAVEGKSNEIMQLQNDLIAKESEISDIKLFYDAEMERNSNDLSDLQNKLHNMTNNSETESQLVKYKELEVAFLELQEKYNTRFIPTISDLEYYNEISKAKSEVAEMANEVLEYAQREDSYQNTIIELKHHIATLTNPHGALEKQYSNVVTVKAKRRGSGSSLISNDFFCESDNYTVMSSGGRRYFPVETLSLYVELYKYEDCLEEKERALSTLETFVTQYEKLSDQYANCEEKMKILYEHNVILQETIEDMKSNAAREEYNSEYIISLQLEISKKDDEIHNLKEEKDSLYCQLLSNQKELSDMTRNYNHISESYEECSKELNKAREKINDLKFTFAQIAPPLQKLLSGSTTFSGPTSKMVGDHSTSFDDSDSEINTNSSK
jgi:predicted  nucleic acid-binding Zn-ribbon protein